MKRLLLATLIIVGLCGLSANSAFAGKKKNKQAATAVNPVSKFDTNNDGKLDKDEIAAIEKDADLMKQYDKNSDGKIDDTEKAALEDALKVSPEPVKKKKKKNAN